MARYTSSDTSELAISYGKTEEPTAHKVWNQRTFLADPAQVCYPSHTPCPISLNIHVEEDVIPDGMGRPGTTGMNAWITSPTPTCQRAG